MKTPESAVLRACLDYLRLRGHFVIRVNNGAFETRRGGWVRCTDTPGAPDIMGVALTGRALAVECKSSVGKLSETQKTFREAWERNNGVYITARRIEDLQEAGL